MKTFGRFMFTLIAILAGIVHLCGAQTADKKTLTLKGAEAVITAAKAEAQKTAGTWWSNRRC